MHRPQTSAAAGLSDCRRFDAEMPAHERLPAQLSVEFIEAGNTVSVIADGRLVGAPLTDARRNSDGYRYHDALHLVLGARLGWSPVLRALLGCKRRSDPDTDRCEDGGRACMVEESICHLIHVHREDAKTEAGMTRLVTLVQRLAAGFEVEATSADAWRGAILSGLDLLDVLNREHGGVVVADFRSGLVHRR